MPRHAAAWGCLSIVSILFVSGGATCARKRMVPDFAPPVVFNATPSLEELTERINRSLAVQQLESNSITITSPEMSAKLAGSLAWERPHNFSLQAYPGTRLLGLAFAAGSNADMFWLQQQMGGPPTLYYAKHNDFENQAGPRSRLPVSPLWLREALGVVELDPSMQHNGPTLRPDGKLEIETFIPPPIPTSPRGPYRRVLVLSPGSATIEQTLLYNDVGKLVAIAQQSEHEYNAELDWSWPHKVKIQLQPDDGPMLAFTVDIEYYMINQGTTKDPSTFTPPDPAGLTIRNLAPGPGMAQAAGPAPPLYTQAAPPSNQQGTLTGYRLVR
ncbi:MAG: hypothetical protein IT422_06405 [Pirellulaceae bacterium]|nr:hypothetical protein [Pirellulaceae bacterium]